MLQKNIGTVDRLIRLGFAILFFIIAWWLYNGWSILFLIAGAFTLFEAVASWCVYYSLIGKSTCPINKDRDKR